MFVPAKTWSSHPHRVTTTQKRHILCSALAASDFPALVISKGHSVEEVAEPAGLQLQEDGGDFCAAEGCSSLN